MEKNWENLTREEKFEQRLEWWLDPPDVKFANAAAAKGYREKVTRLSRAMRCKEPDRVPVTIQSGFFPFYYSGSTLHETMYDYEKLRATWLKYARDFHENMDFIQGPELVHSGRVLDLIKYQLYKWPGHGLETGVNSYQYVEGAYMKADEYNALINDPYEFAIKTFLPRVLGLTQPLQTSTPFSYLVASPLSFIGPMVTPEYQQMLLTLAEAGREMAAWQQVVDECRQTAITNGMPFLGGGYAMAPFDAIADGLRGTKGVVLDMYRQPDNLLAAIDRITPLIIQDAIAMANAAKGIIVGFALHKGDDTFMSQTQFEKFYWPSLKKVILALIDEGIIPWLFAEGRFSTRLETIKDIPKGWVTWMFDQTDMAKAKQSLKDTACIAGNVPASLNCFGSAVDVREYCRQLIKTCAPGGGYILTGGGNLTEAKPDNFRVMMAAAKEFGVY